MVMMMAITPSLNASSRPLLTSTSPLGQILGKKSAGGILRWRGLCTRGSKIQDSGRCGGPLHRGSWLLLRECSESGFETQDLAAIIQVEIVGVAPLVRCAAQGEKHHALHVWVPHPRSPAVGRVPVPCAAAVEGADEIGGGPVGGDRGAGAVATCYLRIAMTPA